jgi:hypothetical protein
LPNTAGRRIAQTTRLSAATVGTLLPCSMEPTAEHALVAPHRQGQTACRALTKS